MAVDGFIRVVDMLVFGMVDMCRVILWGRIVLLVVVTYIYGTVLCVYYIPDDFVIWYYLWCSYISMVMIEICLTVVVHACITDG